MRIPITFDNVERFHSGDEQQTKIFKYPLCFPVQRSPGVVEKMAEVAVKFFEVLFGDIGFGFPPKRGAFIYGLILSVTDHRHGQRDMISPFADDRFEPHRFQIFFRVRLDMQHDAGTRCFAGRGRQSELARAFGSPGEGFAGTGSAGSYFNAISDHESGIKPNSELTDQARPVLRLRGCQFLSKRLGARTGDGAQIVDQILPGHANPVVGDQQCARLLIWHDADFGLGRRRERGIGQCFKPAAIAGIGAIGDQFTQKDFPLGVERVDNKVQQASDLSTKTMFFQYGIVHQSLHRGRYAHLLARFQYKEIIPPAASRVAPARYSSGHRGQFRIRGNGQDRGQSTQHRQHRETGERRFVSVCDIPQHT